jgi:C4-dicarboxylate transporter, DctM subunit
MTASAIGFAVLFAMLFLGVPMGASMAIVGVAGFTLLVGLGPALSMVGQVAVDTVVSYSFSVLPLFILMGAFLSHSRLADDLYNASNAFLGHRRGGLALATIVACGGFAAVCGSSTAAAATMTRVAVPPMKRYGYDIGFAAGTVAAGGTLGILIPPSVIMVIYGLMTENDIGKLFVAGILPGIVAMALYMFAVVATTTWRPELAPPGARAAWPDRWRSLARVWGVLALFALVIGGIYGGVFTPNEAAGIGAAGAFLFAVGRGAFTFRQLVAVLTETTCTTAMMFFVIIGALLFSNFVTVAGLPNALGGWVSGLDASPMTVLLAIVAIYLVLGCILDSISMVLLTVPIFYPVIVQLGFDPIWFGIILVVVVEIGLITPPIGINVFMVKAMLPDVPLYTVFNGIYPFIAADLVRLAILIAFPIITLYLPSLMR